MKITLCIFFFLHSRESASSADENSSSGAPSPVKKKNTKYQIPSADHTYVRQKSNQGLFSESSEHSQSQGQSQDGVTLTSTTTPAAMVTTLELHSEQTSSEHETLTTTKCPEQTIEQNSSHLVEAPVTKTPEVKSDMSASRPSNVTPSDAVKKEIEQVSTATAQHQNNPMDSNVTAMDVADNKDSVHQSAISQGEIKERNEEKGTRDSKELEQSVAMKEEDKTEQTIITKQEHQSGKYICKYFLEI